MEWMPDTAEACQMIVDFEPHEMRLLTVACMERSFRRILGGHELLSHDKRIIRLDADQGARLSMRPLSLRMSINALKDFVRESKLLEYPCNPAATTELDFEKLDSVYLDAAALALAAELDAALYARKSKLHEQVEAHLRENNPPAYEA